MDGDQEQDSSIAINNCDSDDSSDSERIPVCTSYNSSMETESVFGSDSESYTCSSCCSITSPSVSEISDMSADNTHERAYIPPKMMSFKLVGDNIDKNVRPRDMRADNQTRSFHYFHTYAIKDQVDLTHLTDKNVPKKFNPETLLPSSTDKQNLLENYKHLFICVLMKHMPYFKQLGKGLKPQIVHKYSLEMSQKSETVRLSCICYVTMLNKNT